MWSAHSSTSALALNYIYWHMWFIIFVCNILCLKCATCYYIHYSHSLTCCTIHILYTGIPLVCFDLRQLTSLHPNFVFHWNPRVFHFLLQDCFKRPTLQYVSPPGPTAIITFDYRITWQCQRICAPLQCICFPPAWFCPCFLFPMFLLFLKCSFSHV